MNQKTDLCGYLASYYSTSRSLSTDKSAHFVYGE